MRNTARSKFERLGPAPAWPAIKAAAGWSTPILFFPLIGLFSGWIAPGSGLREVAADHGLVFLIIVLVVSLVAVVDSFLSIVRRYGQNSGFPWGPSLMFAAGSLNVIMACRWLLSLPVFP
jgi:hypothetical protein